MSKTSPNSALTQAESHLIEEQLRRAQSVVSGSQTVNREYESFESPMSATQASDLRENLEDALVQQGVTRMTLRQLRILIAAAEEAERERHVIHSAVALYYPILKKEALEEIAQLELQRLALDAPIEALHQELLPLESEANDVWALVGLSPYTDLKSDDLHAAIVRSTPDIETLAGHHGWIPPTPSKPLTRTQYLLDLANQAVVGFIAITTLATIIELISLRDIQSGQYLLWMALALVGILFMYGISITALPILRNTARAWETGIAPERVAWIIQCLAGVTTSATDTSPPPRLRGRWIIHLFLAFYCLAFLGEAIVEAMGFYEVYLSRQTERAFLMGGIQAGHMPTAAALTTVPPIVFVLIGSVITLPLVTRKAMMVWDEAENDLRFAWLRYVQIAWQQLKVRECHTVFRLAAEVANIRNRLAHLLAERLRLEERVEAARTRTDRVCDAALHRAEYNAQGSSGKAHEAIRQALMPPPYSSRVSHEESGGMFPIQ